MKYVVIRAIFYEFITYDRCGKAINFNGNGTNCIDKQSNRFNWDVFTVVVVITLVHVPDASHILFIVATTTLFSWR